MFDRLLLTGSVSIIWNMYSDLYPTSWIMTSDLFSRHLLGLLRPGYPLLVDHYQGSRRGGEGYSGHREVVVLLSSAAKLLQVFHK